MRSKHVPLVAALLFLMLPLLLQSAVPMAYAKGGLDHHSQNQVSIDSVDLSSDGKTLIVKVSTTIQGDKKGNYDHKQVKFTLTASYGPNELDPKHDGKKFFKETATADLTKRSDGQWYAEATFNVPYKGYYYYLFELDAQYEGKGSIGSDWVDPREGVAPE